MLKGIDKLLTGDLLKVLCDMGHGDELVIADANFSAETCAKRLIRLPGIDGVRAVKAIMSVFPLDTYTDDPAIVMALTESDVKKGMRKPIIWDDYQSAVGHLKEIDRFEFYERAKNAYAVIATGEERQYANLLLMKGVVVPEEEKNNGALLRGAEYYRNL